MDVPAIDVEALAEVLRSDELPPTLIDVRGADEYDVAHVPGARLLPLREVPERVGELPTAEPVYVICASGPRSERATRFLRAQGIDAVNVDGGTMAWIDSGRAVATGTEP